MKYPRPPKQSGLAASAVLLSATFWTTPAVAFDGCRVILCLAGSWRSIPECVPDVREALRCMARGRCWPTCPAAGGTSLSWASGANCPPQYTIQDYNTGNTYCSKTGVVDVTWQSQPYWMRVWFNTGSNDNSVAIQYSDAARSALGENIDPTFDNDYAVWLATQPPKGWGGDNGPGY